MKRSAKFNACRPPRFSKLVHPGFVPATGGSDWPQVGFWGAMPNVGDLLDVLAESAPDLAARDAILVTNPARLYGFPGAEMAGS